MRASASRFLRGPAPRLRRFLLALGLIAGAVLACHLGALVRDELLAGSDDSLEAELDA